MIKHLYVSNFFGSKALDVNFNEDLTILVGRNGSGKTTVLNIISSIASGNISNLFRYDFDEIILDYYKSEDRSVKIYKHKPGLFKLEWNGKTETINTESMKKFSRNRAFTQVSENNYYKKILEEIALEINLLYLPLSRDIRPFDSLSRTDNYQRFLIENYKGSFYEYQEQRPVSNIEETIGYVNELVKENHRKIMLEFEKISQDMRKQMFQTSFHYSDSLPDVLKNIDNLNEQKIEGLKSAFKEMGILTKEFNEAINLFFEKLRAGRTAFDEISEEKVNKDSISFLINAPLVDRIIQWTEIAQDVTNKKNEANRSMAIFLDTVNSFIGESASAKNLCFNDNEGVLSFKIIGEMEKNFSLDRLSSGEKQIVIFFAYLIFKTNNKESCTFIVDEPELSLHLSWQKKFCKSIMQAAPGLQLIFATHAPEIIGPYRSNCFIMGGGNK